MLEVKSSEIKMGTQVLPFFITDTHRRRLGFMRRVIEFCEDGFSESSGYEFTGCSSCIPRSKI
jgi:hypothetical protein